MFISKGPKSNVSSRSSGSTRKLFADYPYPILTELDQIYEQRQRRSSSSKFKSSRWYKDNFRKLISLLQERDSDSTSNTIVEQSLRQNQLNAQSLKSITADSPLRFESLHGARISYNSIISQCDTAERANHIEDTQSISFEI